MCIRLHNPQLTGVSGYNAGMPVNISSFRSLGTAALSLACLTLRPAAGASWIDFRPRTAATNGWTFSGIAWSSERGLKFTAPDAAAESPLSMDVLTSLVTVTYCSGARVDRPFVVLAGPDPGHLVVRDPPIAYVYTKYATNTFAFAAAEGVRVVRIRCNVEGEVKGNYYLTAAGLGSGDAPAPDDPPAADEGTGAWRMSEFAGGSRGEDFAWATNVTKATTWENGVTVPGFHAFRNGEAVVSIGRDSGKAVVAGLYASCPGDGRRTLSLLGSSGAEVALELHVLNDGCEALAGAEVAWEACQWTFPESEPRALSFEWAVTRTAERPAEGAWREADGTGLESVAAPPAGTAGVVAPRRAPCGHPGVPPGGMLWLRWRAPRLAGSPMFGVGDVRVTPVRRRGTTLFVR